MGKKIDNTLRTVDLDIYTDPRTGKPFDDNGNIEDSEKVKITSGDYAVIDTKAVLLLSSILNRSDLANVLKMSVKVKTPMNIVYNHNLPHSNKTLMKYLSISSESTFHLMIKRLIKVGVLYQIKGRIHGKVRVCYMLNPFLSRKRVIFEKEVLEVFKEFATDDFSDLLDVEIQSR